MQEFARYTANYGGYSYCYILLWELLRQNINENNSTIKLQAIIQVNGYYISWDRGNATLHTDNFGLNSTYYTGNTVVHDMMTTVSHNSDGTGSIYIGGSISTSFVMNGSCGGVINLPTIPRYLIITRHAISDIKITSVRIDWATDSVRDWTQYKLNDGPWTDARDIVAPDSKSGYYILNNLTPNTRYKIRTRLKRTDSQLWTESNDLEFTTSSKTVKVRVDGEYKEATIYVGVDGKWEIGIPYIGINNEWKRGN